MLCFGDAADVDAADADSFDAYAVDGAGYGAGDGANADYVHVGAVEDDGVAVSTLDSDRVEPDSDDLGVIDYSVCLECSLSDWLKTHADDVYSDEV